jgi:hypothetical protein
VGGFAVIQAGFHRFTGDIKFLIDPSLENEGRVFEALRVLPDKAVRELSSGDVSKYIVVRVADEVVVDLMANACGVNYADAIQDAKFSEIDGVKIPFASPKTLLRMKQTVRDKDIADRAFLQQVIDRATAKKEETSFLGAVIDEIKKRTGGTGK